MNIRPNHAKSDGIPTTRVIQSLALELESFEAYPAKVLFLQWCTMGASGVTLALFYNAPLRMHLMEHLLNPRFFLESLTWLLFAMISAAFTLSSSLPGRSCSKEKRAALILGGIIIGFIFSRFSLFHLQEQISGEMDLYRGRCGPIIFSTSIVLSVWMMFLIRKLAPTHLRATSIALSLFTGAFSAFLMQFICEYENTPHLLIWHVAPILILSVFTVKVGQRVLRW